MTQKQGADSEKSVASDTGHKRVLQGVVVSDKMQKTIVVKVDRNVKHKKYMKFVTLSKRYKAHDESREAKVGDRVEIIESRPISQDKRWALRRVLERAALQ